MSDEKPLAHKYFDAYMKSSMLEDDLSDAILEAVGVDPDNVDEWPCADITYDWYDTSFEFKGTKKGWKLPRSAKKKLRQLGFSRCWICYVDGSEEYYSLY